MCWRPVLSVCRSQFHCDHLTYQPCFCHIMCFAVNSATKDKQPDPKRSAIRNSWVTTKVFTSYHAGYYFVISSKFLHPHFRSTHSWRFHCFHFRPPSIWLVCSFCRVGQLGLDGLGGEEDTNAAPAHYRVWRRREWRRERAALRQRAASATKARASHFMLVCVHRHHGSTNNIILPNLLSDLFQNVYSQISTLHLRVGNIKYRVMPHKNSLGIITERKVYIWVPPTLGLKKHYPTSDAVGLKGLNIDCTFLAQVTEPVNMQTGGTTPQIIENEIPKVFGDSKILHKT